VQRSLELVQLRLHTAADLRRGPGQRKAR
jgi:hypothetical protein